MWLLSYPCLILSINFGTKIQGLLHPAGALPQQRRTPEFLKMVQKAQSEPDNLAVLEICASLHVYTESLLLALHWFPIGFSDDEDDDDVDVDADVDDYVDDDDDTDDCGGDDDPDGDDDDDDDDDGDDGDDDDYEYGGDDDDDYVWWWWWWRWCWRWRWRWRCDSCLNDPMLVFKSCSTNLYSVICFAQPSRASQNSQ